MMPADKYQAGAHLWEARWSKPTWEVIEEVVKAWGVLQPTRWESHIVRLNEVKRAQKVTNVGTKSFRGVSKDKENDAYLSLVVDIPMWIELCIRKLFTVEDLPFDKEYYRKFAKKFPVFRVREAV